jgi:hypothetical protein
MNEWVRSIGGMLLTEETEVLGEKHYTVWVVDEWIWSYGGIWLTGETEVLGQKHYTVSVVDGWMSMEHWWNDTDRGNWSTWRKHYTASVVDEWMSMEHWWNDTDRAQPKYSDKNLSQSHYIHHKSHMDTDWLGAEPGPPKWEAGD